MLVVTSAFTAEFGGASGGVVNATKQGTNTFHGSAYEFNRVSALAANSFNNNAFGDRQAGIYAGTSLASLRGSIIKDKLLCSINAEWTRVRSVGAF